MKKTSIIAALALAAGCALAFTGCGGSSKNIASLDSNWYSGINFTRFQPTFTQGNQGFSAEELTYAVTFDGSGAANPSYTVNYAEGTYKTTFYAKTLSSEDIDKITLSEYRGYYPHEMQAYYYKTELTVPSVTFTLKSDNTKTVTFEGDSIITENYFLSVADYLRPVYSMQTVKSVTPRNYQVSDIDATYVKINRTYENFYSTKYDALDVVVTKTTVKSEENFVDYGYEDFKGEQSGTAKTAVSEPLNVADTDYTVFDISSLNVVTRACKLTSGENLSQAISLYVPWSAEGINDFGIAGSSAPLVLDKDEAQNTAKINELTSKLQAKGLYKEQKDAEGKPVGLKTVALNVGTTAGVSQTYWYAAVNGTHNNVGHATMLKLSTPVAFGLGVINYTLSEITSTFAA